MSSSTDTPVRLHFLEAALPNGFPGAQPVKPELKLLVYSVGPASGTSDTLV